MNIEQRHLIPALLCAFVWVMIGAGASGQTLVIPGAMQTVEGNINNCFPFDAGSYGFRSMRYQQVYAASEFAAIHGPIVITQISFRPDARWGGNFDAVLADIQINLSTTQAGPDALSDVFSANVGADDTVVYSGSLRLGSSFGGPEGGPMDFDIKIPLTTPFRYDPKSGNLLLDVRNFSGGTLNVPFDAQAQIGDSVSCVYTYGEDTVQDTYGYSSGEWSFGLVTQFTLGKQGPAPVAFDIKPQDYPNFWNIKSEGVLPAAILGSRDFDVSTVDPASIRLAGIAPLRSAIADVGAYCVDCTQKGPDGYGDLSLKFASSELLKSIQSILGREPYDGEVVSLVLKGSLKAAAGGAAIQAEDFIVILKKGKKLSF